MEIKTSKSDYEQIVKTKTPKSKIVQNCFLAFLAGGGICTFGQWLFNYFKGFGLDETTASGAVSIVLIFLGAFFTGIGWYDKLAKYAGAGTMVPISGFANSIVSPALEFKTEGYIAGTAAKMFVIAGPVLVYGITVSMLLGLIQWFVSMFNI